MFKALLRGQITLQVRDNWHLTCRWGARNSVPPQILNPVAMTERSVKLHFSVDEVSGLQV